MTQDRWQLVDRATQRWVVATGREVALADQSWLAGPVGDAAGIGDGWIDAHATRIGAATSTDDDPGLLPDMAVLDGPGFRAADVAAPIRDFYAHTAAWSLELWSRWSRWAEPGGRALNAVFARRLRQLALPLDPLASARGMTSRVIGFSTPDAGHVGTAWQRELRSTGDTVFGGFYGVASLPREDRPSVRMVFPLPNGSLVVFLRPDVDADGSLHLVSPPGDFGCNGAYLVVVDGAGDRATARRVPLHEHFHVFVDDRGTLRCDHTLDLWSRRVLHLHYRMDPGASGGR